MRKIIILTMVLAYCLWNVERIEAVNGGGIYLSPPFQDIEIGLIEDEKQFLLEMGNKGEVTETMELTVVDFGSLDESGGVAFLTTKTENSERKYALASWLVLEKSSVIVEPGQLQKVKVTVVNKESLTAGGHYGAILVTTKPGELETARVVGLKQSMATLIYVLKTGGETKNLVFKSWEWKKNWFKFPDKIELRFENPGNVHVVPRGIVRITNTFKTMIAKGIINEASGRILPESFRKFSVTMKPMTAWIWPGVYSLKTEYRFDGKDNFDFVENSFIYVGKEGIFLGSCGLILVGILLAIKRRNNRR